MPLIVTLTIDSSLQDFFERQRQRYYPNTLNQIPAHLCLFHQLPEIHLNAIDITLQKTAANHSPLDVHTIGIQLLGKGNAYKLSFDKRIFLQLQTVWWDWLIKQDRQPWNPHVTIQNKVTSKEAKELYERLQSSFVPHAGKILGFDLWKYLEGPWRLITKYPFLREF